MSYNLGTAHGKIELEYNGGKATAKATGDMEKVKGKSKETDSALKNLGATMGTLGGIARKAGLGALFVEAGVGAANLAIQLLGSIPQLVSISSLAAALPALFTGGAAAVGVLQASFKGVGTAIKDAFDPKKAADFNDQLAKLSPSAAAFAKAIKSAAPALTNMQKGIQESFFAASHLATAVPLITGALSKLSPEVNGLAADFGELTRQAVNFSVSDDSITFFNTAIAATRAGLSEASSALLPLLAGIRAVGTVGAPLLTRLGEAVGQVGTRFGNWMSQVSASGQLQDWINTGIATLQTLGGIVKNVGNILFSVIKGAQAVGGGFLNTLEQITGTFATFLKSAEGAAAIREVFGAITAVAKPLAPAITKIVSVIAQGLGPAVIQVAGSIGGALMPVLDALAPAIAPLGQAIASLVKAITPVLQPAAQLVAIVAKFVALVAQDLSAALGPVIQLLAGGLSQAFTALAPAIDSFATLLPQAASAGAQLAQALAPLVPALVQVAQAMAQGLIQSMPQLIASSIQLANALIPLVTILASGLAAVLTKIAPLIPSIVQAFVGLQTIMVPIVVVISNVVQFLQKLGQAIVGIPAFLNNLAASLRGALLGALGAAGSAIASFANTAVSFFAALPGRILAGIRALPGLILGVVRGALGAAATAVGFGIGILVGLFTKFPRDAYNAIRSLINSVPAVLHSAWSSAVAATASGVNSVVAWARGVPSRVHSAVSGIIGGLRSVASSAWNSFRSATVSGANAAVSYVRGIPGRIRSAVGNLGSLLFSAGANIVHGLLNGLRSAAGGVIAEAQNLASRIKSAFNSALSIFSPSRVFIESGEFIDEGIIIGLQNKMGQVANVATQLAKTVIDPTLQVPNVATTALSTVTALPAVKASADAFNRDFGPYELKVDQGVLTSFTIDAVTGAPKAVASAVTEGNRQASWVGSGRGN